jgi:hypothetical protein
MGIFRAYCCPESGDDGESVRVVGKRSAGAIALMAMLLMGCSAPEPAEEGSPTGTPTSPPASTPTQGSDERGPEEPTATAAMDQDNRRGAAAFTRYYIALLNYATLTGDVKRLVGHSHNCRGCSVFESLYKKTYAQGGYFDGFQWTISSLVPFRTGDDYRTLVSVEASGGKYKENADAKEERHAGSTYNFRFEAAYRPRGWVMHEMVATSD